VHNQNSIAKARKLITIRRGDQNSHLISPLNDLMDLMARANVDTGGGVLED
jgi:hypothetical protein